MNGKLRRACSAALRDIFHMDDFRPGQKAAASTLLSGRDLLCILPTGAGKSLCWQLPAVVHNGLTVVVSPLIALMQDQVRHLHERGIAAVTINSLMPPEERTAAMDAIRSGRVRIVFVSPERLQAHTFLELCQAVQPWLVVVDEAHCVAEWGGEFRPAYARIGTFVGSLPARPVLCAMTATADRRMQRQIISSLRMAFPKRVTLPVIRENLHYRVVTTVGRTREIIRLMAQKPGSTVIFCRSRARTEHLAAQLRSAGFASEHYHAGLDREERLRAQERFQNGTTMVLAATTAFGMGIDIPNIRCVIHDALPDSITDLVQQSGRAGRDGEEAECIILLEPGDLLGRSAMLHAARLRLRWRPAARYAEVRKRWLPLKGLLRAVMTEPCIPAAFAEAFGQRTARCGCCSACRCGPLVKRVPSLPYMREEEMRLWLLRWQRDSIAVSRGVLPERIMTRSQLRVAAETLTIPPLEDAKAESAMERIMEAIRPGGVHENHRRGER